jgi:hypothetical protein
MSAHPHQGSPPSPDSPPVVEVGVTCTVVLGAGCVTVVFVVAVTVRPGCVTVVAGCVTVVVAVASVRCVGVVAVDAAFWTCWATVPAPPPPHEATAKARATPASSEQASLIGRP